MLIALLSDIHANREAFAACLAQARHRGGPDVRDQHVYRRDEAPQHCEGGLCRDEGLLTALDQRLKAGAQAGRERAPDAG